MNSRIGIGYSLVTILFFCCCTVQVPSTANAGSKKRTNYYVDAIAGDDGNSGKSPKQAWQSLEEIADRTFKPGDSILFKSGQIWYGRLVLRSSGSSEMSIVIASYGTGNKPI